MMNRDYEDNPLTPEEILEILTISESNYIFNHDQVRSHNVPGVVEHIYSTLCRIHPKCRPKTTKGTFKSLIYDDIIIDQYVANFIPEVNVDFLKVPKKYLGHKFWSPNGDIGHKLKLRYFTKLIKHYQSLIKL